MTPDVFRRSDEAGDSTAEGVPSSDQVTGKDATPVEVTVNDLQSQLAALKSELQEWQDRFLRKAAEFDNYRKRMEKEKGETAQLAKSSVLMEFLPVADACERAMQSLDGTSASSENLDHYREGVRLLYKQIHDVFARIGVVPVAAQGQKFDPHFHEAIAREEDPEHEENIVTLELRRGYLFKGRLLRPAQVKVATRPQSKISTEA